MKSAAQAKLPSRSPRRTLSTPTREPHSAYAISSRLPPVSQPTTSTNRPVGNQGDSQIERDGEDDRERGVGVQIGQQCASWDHELGSQDEHHDSAGEQDRLHPSEPELRFLPPQVVQEDDTQQKHKTRHCEEVIPRPASTLQAQRLQHLDLQVGDDITGAQNRLVALDGAGDGFHGVAGGLAAFF